MKWAWKEGRTDVATSSRRRTWRESRHRCCREADGGRGWIDAARVDRRRRRRRRMLPSSDEFHHLGSAFVCCPPRMSFTIWDWRSFGREEEDEEDDGDGSREKNNDKGTMTTTNDCSGHGRHNFEGRLNRNIIAIGRRWRWHSRTSRRLPPRGPSLADIIRGRGDAARKRCRLAAVSTPPTTTVK
jgi:hypothetical protein